MIPNKFELGHVTITFTSPMLVATGESQELTDAMCIRDPNGCPTIPGTSITGVLRSAFARQHSDLEDVVFGALDANGKSHRSKITVGWGHLHDQTDRPVSHVVSKPSENPDPVLGFVSAGVHRDFVRIGEHGTAVTGAKFEQDLVPRGARFTFMLMLDTDGLDASKVSLSSLVGLLNHRSVRLGGQTRRGAGEFSVTDFRMEAFDLTDAEDFKRFSEVSFDLSKPSLLNKAEFKTIDFDKAETHFHLELEPKDFFHPGGGYSMEGVFPKLSGDSRVEKLDMFPVFERQVQWNGGKGLVTEPYFYIPSTAIKGVLRHRTLFYLRALYGEWAPAKGNVADRLADCLFGTLLDASNPDKEQASYPGCVQVTEPVLSADVGYRIMQHVSLDAFTQSPMTGALFGEVVLEGTDVKFDISVSIDWSFFNRMAAVMNDEKDREQCDASEAQESCFKALRKAIEDLTGGRLPLGGGSSRGHGCMKGTEAVEGYNV